MVLGKKEEEKKEFLGKACCSRGSISGIISIRDFDQKGATRMAIVSTEPGNEERRLESVVLEPERYDALEERLYSEEAEDPTKLLAFFAKTEPVYR